MTLILYPHFRKVSSVWKMEKAESIVTAQVKSDEREPETR